MSQFNLGIVEPSARVTSYYENFDGIDGLVRYRTLVISVIKSRSSSRRESHTR